MSTWRSSSSISISPSSSMTGETSRPANAVWRRLAESNGRDPHEPVDALLGAEEAVGVVAADAEGGGLDAGLLPRAGLEQLDVEAARLGPAHLHPQDHLRPVLRVGAAGAGVDGDQRVAGVVAARRTGAPPPAPRGAPRRVASCSSSSAAISGSSSASSARPSRSSASAASGVGRSRRRRAGAGVLGADLRGRLLVVPEPRGLHLPSSSAIRARSASGSKDARSSSTPSRMAARRCGRAKLAGRRGHAAFEGNAAMAARRSARRGAGPGPGTGDGRVLRPAACDRPAPPTRAAAGRGPARGRGRASRSTACCACPSSAR